MTRAGLSPTADEIERIARPTLDALPQPFAAQGANVPLGIEGAAGSYNVHALEKRA